MDTTEKFATKINKCVLTRLRGYAKRNNQTIALVVSEAVAQYLDRAEVRQPFRDAAKEILDTQRTSEGTGKVKDTVYPSLEEALYLHSLLIERFGGAPGVLDKGLLESAIARPRSGYYSSLSEQAAALLQSLAMNDPFVDGNKRLAFALTSVFLELNGYSIQLDARSGVGIY